jgi:pilus assembly protein CpaE
MYPLNVCLIGRDEGLTAAIRRELTRCGALVQAEFRNVETAAASLRASSEEMRLFIFSLHNQGDLDQLRRLSSTFVGRPIIALVPEGSDLPTVLAVMRAGAMQVIVLPLDSEDCQQALQCVALQFGHPPTETSVIAVSGVTGGCGASTFALNLAYEIAEERGQKCCLVELSFKMGSLATYLDVEPKFTTQDLFALGNRLDFYVLQGALLPVTDKLSFLAGPQLPTSPLTPTAADVTHLLSYVKQLAGVVVLDLPCTYDDCFYGTLAGVSQVVLVGEQKVASIRALKVAQESLTRDPNIPPARLLINRYDSKLPGLGLDRLTELLGTPEVLTLANDYSAVMTAVNNGKPLRVDAPKSTALADIRRLMYTLLDEPPPSVETVRKAPTKTSVFRRLAQAFRLF